jgi:hypothetical protein
MRTPTWREVEEFCRIDGWRPLRSTNHTFHQKVLPDGTVLETHASFSGDKTMSPGRFALILRTQLKVSQDDFWEALRTGRPVKRPSAPLPAAPPAVTPWVANALKRQFGKTDEEIAAMDPAEAERFVRDRWSSPPESDEAPGAT